MTKNLFYLFSLVWLVACDMDLADLIPVNQMEKIKSDFSEFDADHSGSLDIGELQSLLSPKGTKKKIPLEEAQTIMEKQDYDKNQALDKDQFLEFALGDQLHLLIKIAQSLEEMDGDQDKLISKKELDTYLASRKGIRKEANQAKEKLDFPLEKELVGRFMFEFVPFSQSELNGMEVFEEGEVVGDIDPEEFQRYKMGAEIPVEMPEEMQRERRVYEPVQDM